MFSSANARCMLVAFLIMSPAAELQASSFAAGLGLGQGLGGVASYSIDKFVLTSIDTIGKIAVVHPMLVGGVVVTVAIVGSTLYYFDRVHKREMDQIERLMATGKFILEIEVRPDGTRVSRIVPITSESGFPYPG